MATHEYHLEEGESPKVEKMKPRMTIDEDMHKHLSSMSVGNKMSMLVSGRVCSMREGYGKDKKLEAEIEIDKIDNMKMMGNKKEDEQHGKDS